MGSKKRELDYPLVNGTANVENSPVPAKKKKKSGSGDYDDGAAAKVRSVEPGSNGDTTKKDKKRKKKRDKSRDEIVNGTKEAGVATADEDANVDAIFMGSESETKKERRRKK